MIFRLTVYHAALIAARNQLLDMAAHDQRLAGVRANGIDDQPQYHIEIDREKASALGINLSVVDQTFSIAWGSQYVNNFLDTDGRIKRVYVQADAPFRMNPEDLQGLFVRNTAGTMVPFRPSSWPGKIIVTPYIVLFTANRSAASYGSL